MKKTLSKVGDKYIPHGWDRVALEAEMLAIKGENLGGNAWPTCNYLVQLSILGKCWTTTPSK